MPMIQTLEGKPLTITLPGGDKRELGKVTRAESRKDSIFLQIKVTDEEIKASVAGEPTDAI